MKKLIPLLLLVSCFGCASYTSYIEVPTIGRLALPKDAKFDGLSLEKVDTNGNRLTFTITNAMFTMNPAVIDAKTAHDIAMFDSWTKFFVSIMTKTP